MSVLTKGLAMDFVREGRTDMSISSIWPASVSMVHSSSQGASTKGYGGAPYPTLDSL